MRTTIDLPDDLHRIATSIARDRKLSLSATVAELVRRGLRTPEGPGPAVRDGFPVVSVGRVIAAADVRELDDE